MNRLRFFLTAAYRQTRRIRFRLLLCSFAISVSVAAFTGISLFRTALTNEIELQSKTLLGADLILTTREKPTDGLRSFLNGIPGLVGEGVQFLTMISSGEDLKLVQVRAIDPGFPIYGELETEPVKIDFHNQWGVVVDEPLLLQFHLKVGDQLKIGAAEFPILGKLLQVPGEVAGYALVAPRVYLSRSALQETALLGFGSQARYRFFFRGDEENVQRLVQERRGEFQEKRLEVDTVSMRRESIAKTVERVSRFLSLSALITALLGGIGIGSATLLLVRAKEVDIRILRLIGGKRWEVTVIFLLLVGFLGLISSVVGAVLGAGISQLFPRVFESFLPVKLVVPLSLFEILKGVTVGVALSLLSAIIPLASVFRSSPLRISFSLSPVALILTITGFLLLSILQYGEVRIGLLIGGGIILSFFILVLLSRVTARLLGALPLRTAPFPIRYGIRALSRRGGSSGLLTGAIGCGVTLLLLVSLSQRSIQGEIALASDQSRPSQVLFDIQREQLPPLVKLLEREGAPVFETTPIVTMRLRSLKGRSVADLLNDKTTTIPLWSLKREYRSTYRGELGGSERIVEGEWVGEVTAGASVIPLSIEKGIANDLGLALGDELSIDLQGVLLQGVVRSIREVDWRRLQPNFFILFPKGVIEEAPQFFALTTRTGDLASGVKLQQKVVGEFPNISVVDLRSAVQSLQAVLAKIGFAVNFMGVFTLLAGVIILAGSALNGAAARMKEAALLKLLGGRKRSVHGALLMEFSMIGVVSAVTAAGLTGVAGFLLSRYLLNTEFLYPVTSVLWALIGTPLLTAFIGGIFTTSLYKKSALDALRGEL